MVYLGKVDAVVGVPIPNTLMDVRRIVFLASWITHVVPGYSALIPPMMNLLRNNQPFVWTEWPKSLAAVKDYLIFTPILTGPNFTKQIFVYTDASDFG